MGAKRSSTLVCVCVLTAAACSPAPAEELFALATGERDLYRIDTGGLGSPTLVGNISAGADLYGLVWLSQDRLYTFDRDANTVITVSAQDASVLNVTPLDRDILGHPRGFDLSPSGVLYGVFGDMELYTVDPATGDTAFVAKMTGAARVEALAFSRPGALYAVGSAEADNRSETLYSLNPGTGVLSTIGPMGVNDVDCLTFGKDGYLYGADSLVGNSADLYRIDPQTGAATVLGDSGVIELNGIAVPEPAALALLALGGLVLARRRRGGLRAGRPGPIPAAAGRAALTRSDALHSRPQKSTRQHLLEIGTVPAAGRNPPSGPPCWLVPSCRSALPRAVRPSAGQVTSRSK